MTQISNRDRSKLDRSGFINRKIQILEKEEIEGKNFQLRERSKHSSTHREINNHTKKISRIKNYRRNFCLRL